MDVLMPQLGETVAEGKITKWFKSAGDVVKPGDNLFEIETDKVSMEIQATAGGVLSEIRVPAGEVALVGAVVAVIADGASTKTTAPKAAAPAPAPAAPRRPAATTATAPVPAPAAPAKSRPLRLDPFFEVRTPERHYGPAKILGGTAVTPLARRLAAETGIDLTAIKGSGPHGRIVARDIATGARIAARPAAQGLAAGPTADEVKALYRDTPHEEISLDGMRRTIAQRLTQATQTIPHFYLTADLDIDLLFKLREEINATAPRAKDGKTAFKISVNDLLIKAWAAALQRVPAANAVWAEDRILRLRHSDVAVAVAIEGGLITPVIHRAETKTLRAISAEMRDLATRARERKLKPHEYQGGSSAISNLGMFGIREFSAIINPPHATILAVGAARRQAVEKGSDVTFAGVMTVTLSCDHRLVDGVLGAELLTTFKSIVEKPMTALA